MLMKPQKLITFALLAFVAVSIGYLVKENTRESDTQVMDSPAIPSEKALAAGKASESLSPDASSETTAADGIKVVAQYFHGTMRCDTCMAIESLTFEALNSRFSEELKSGKLEIQSINVDESANGHFVEDYQLTTRTVVIASFVNGEQGEWRRLDQVWPLAMAGDRDKFIEYVQKETDSLLEKAS